MKNNSLFKTLSADDKEKVLTIADNIETAFKTGGYDLSGERLTIADALAYPDSHLAIQKVKLKS
jgi:glutathione S-transferase